MNKTFTILIILTTLLSNKLCAEDVKSEDTVIKSNAMLSEYVCTNLNFTVFESFDFNNIEEVQLLVKANPKRFEPYLFLAKCLLDEGKTEKANEAFKTVDKLSGKVKDVAVLHSLTYENLYAFTLFAEAEQRLLNKENPVKCLRMFQQVLGMDTSSIKESKRMSRLYMYVSTIYLTRGEAKQAMFNAERGKETWEREKPDFDIDLFNQVIMKAQRMK